jgi:hypothetical protein
MGAERLNAKMANKSELAHLAALANMAASRFSDKNRRIAKSAKGMQEKFATADERRSTQMIIYLRPSAFICGCNTSCISLANLGR